MSEKIIPQQENSQQENSLLIFQLLSKYAVETHWYINATNKELRENNDTPSKSFERCSDIELELKKLGYIFQKPNIYN